MDQYVKINIKESVRTKLKEQAATKGMTLADYIESLAAGDTTQPAQSTQSSMEIIDMSDWVDGEAPECCIDTIANNFKPGHVCSDWVRVGYTDKNGLCRQAWFNNRTGEYEFSDRWQKIKAEYMYQ